MLIHRKGRKHNEEIAISEILSMKFSPKIFNIIISDYLTLKQKPTNKNQKKDTTAKHSQE
jgi:hypothetical protein